MFDLEFIHVGVYVGVNEGVKIHVGGLKVHVGVKICIRGVKTYVRGVKFLGVKFLES